MSDSPQSRETRTGPYRWDLVAPDQLGTLLTDTPEPDLWFVDGLVECTGKILARSGGGDLVFVGRSLDSAYDLLSGALNGSRSRDRIHRLDLSLSDAVTIRSNQWVPMSLTPMETDHLHRALAGVGASPELLAHRSRPLTFVDVVHESRTFTALFAIVKDWADADRVPWDAIRRKLRFLGVTSRKQTSPNTYRWHQDAAWTSQLPPSSIRNVSLDARVWSHLADAQIKLTRSHVRDRWLARADGPHHDEKTRIALAEAAALVAYGQTLRGRRALTRATAGEPALRESWLRSLVTELNR